MKNRCDCYHTRKEIRYTYHPITGQPIGHDIEVGVCWGTKEMDECSCGGDEAECDFYPDIRKEARKEREKIGMVVTNADHIRSMNDEELAKFLCSNTECGSCKWAVFSGCELKNWLRQPLDIKNKKHI